MLDKSAIGFETKPRAIVVESGQLKSFAKATGEKNPIYLHEGAARDAGHKSLPAPPSFLYCLQSMADNLDMILDHLGVELGRILHGEQKFIPATLIYAGDSITLKSRIADLYDKKGGALDFIIMETSASNQHGDSVGISRTTLVVRNG